MTYARARLWTGIAGVGMWVVLSSVALASGAPGLLLDGVGGDALGDARALAGLFLLVIAFRLPLDVLGGLVLPRSFARPAPTLPGFALGWLRGVLVHAGLCVGSGVLLLAVGRQAGLLGALCVLVLLMVALLALQEPVARWIGGLRVASPQAEALRARFAAAGVEPPDVRWLDTPDPAFSGGFCGLGRRSLVLPTRWLRELDADEIALLARRRLDLEGDGLRLRGVALAASFNALGFALAATLPGAGVATLAELVTTAAGFTLWSFLGLLVLPTWSRWATFAADAGAVRETAGAAGAAGDERRRLVHLIEALDRSQDDEPERPRWVERIFHPVPSAASRVRALRAGGDAPRAGAWHLARTALYLSAACLGVLGRVVHCNAGRPALWVYLPADG